MKGKILAIEENGGIILGDDEKRYKFDLNEWREKIPPAKGAEVDFETDENIAKNIYFIGAVNYPRLNIESNTPILGGLGTIFLILGWIPYIGFIFSIIGIIMISIALKRFSDKAKEKGIFKKWIISIVLGFVAMFLFVIAFFILLSLSNYDTSNNDILFGSILIIGYLIFVTLQIILGILYKQIFYSVYEITNEKLFKTAADVFFWGGILSIIFIGGILFFIGWIIIAVAFFSIKTE